MNSEQNSFSMGSSTFGADRVIYSIAIVYSESLFNQVRETDQHIIVSLISILFAVIACRLGKWWTAQCKTHTNPKCSALWEQIVTQWFQIAELTLTFIAIHSIVEVLNNMISQTEQYYYEALLFPVITLMFAISTVTVIDERLGVSHKE